MTPPETLIRDRVQTVFASTFSSEGWTAADDKLPRAAGKDGHAVAAVYPEEARENPRVVNELIIPVVLQLYLAYEAEPDEHIVVDPGVIEGYADRLRGAFETQSSGSSGDFWFLRLVRIAYPDDPTGNKSRLEAFIEGHAQNTAGLPS